MLIYTLKRFGRYIDQTILYNEQLTYTPYTSDAMEFKTPEDAAKFVVDNGLLPHEIVPVAIKYTEEQSLPTAKRLYFSDEDRYYKQ